MVNSSFSYYRDALLFGMMLNWGLEVQSFDLTTEQSVAAFALAQRLAVRPPPSATRTPMATDGAQEYTEAGEPTPEKSQKVRYDAPTIKNAKTIRKRIGATRRTQKLAKALEHYLKAQGELPEEEYTPGQPALEMQVQSGEELAGDVWSIILDCDDPGKKAPKPADKHKKKKEKLKREHHKKGKGKGRGSRKHLSDLSCSEEDSSTSSSDSSSSSSSGETPRKGTSRSASASSSWSPAKPTMVIIDGKEHFRGKTSNNLIDCSHPPQPKCRFCKAHHWFGKVRPTSARGESHNDYPVRSELVAGGEAPKNSSGQSTSWRQQLQATMQVPMQQRQCTDSASHRSKDTCNNYTECGTDSPSIQVTQCVEQLLWEVQQEHTPWYTLEYPISF